MTDHLTIKDKLAQYEDIKKEISELNAKIEKLEKEGFKLAAVQESRKRAPFGKHDIIIEAQSPKTRNLMSMYKSMLQDRLEELLEVQIEVEEYISELPTSRLRRIFELRYINQYTWRKIAYIMHTSEDSIKQEHSRFLKEN